MHANQITWVVLENVLISLNIERKINLLSIIRDVLIIILGKYF